MNNPLSNLKLDYWYHVLMVASLVILILSLTVKLININNSLVQLISLGVFILSLGEWINHPLQTTIHPPTSIIPTGGQITGYPRSNSLIGILFVLIGLILIIWPLCL